MLLFPLAATTPPTDPTVPSITYGKGSPQGVIKAPKGSVYLRTDGGAASTLYVKTSGTGTSGWTAK